MKPVETIEIMQVNYLEKYTLQVYFSDNTLQIIDFELFLIQNRNPLTRKYLNIQNFKTYRIEYGDLVWGDYELCFPIWDLHEGKI